MSFEKLAQTCEKELKGLEAPKTCQKDVLFHIMVNKESLGDSCKKATNQHIEEYLPGIKTL